ncbi:MAG: MrcB family domain-containing protein [Anaerolineaceae bacterium]
MENSNETMNKLQHIFQNILDIYQTAQENEPFGRNNSVWKKFTELEETLKHSALLSEFPAVKIKWSIGAGNWAAVPWIAFLDSRETNTTQKGVYAVFLFPKDMSGVYITFNQGVTEPINQHGTINGRRMLRENAERLRNNFDFLLRDGFCLDNNIDLRVSQGLGLNYQVSTIAYKFYEKTKIPADKTIIDDIETVLTAYDTYINSRNEAPNITKGGDMTSLNYKIAFENLLNFIEASGFVFQPWQVATYVTAIRTKPFVILAGISGTGKSKLPALVAKGTGGEPTLIPVRPDWTDSSDVLGFVNLQDEFQPGLLLRVAETAQLVVNKDKHYIVIVDEMNLARVEHYFAEVLSQIENRKINPEGGYSSDPLFLQTISREEDKDWSKVTLPSNLAIIGTVNMDESSHGFSRKVLDRAFTIEFSDIDLSLWEFDQNLQNKEVEKWPIKFWQPRAIQLSRLAVNNPTEKQYINDLIVKLSEINSCLKPAQLQVGYRTRDEIVLFSLHAKELDSFFVSRQGDNIDPFDLALQMKILPRIVGGSNTIRQVIADLLTWSVESIIYETEDKVEEIYNRWVAEGRPSVIEGVYPRTAARLCLMWERLKIEGFTSYWL